MMSVEVCQLTERYNLSLLNPANIYLSRVSNRSTRKKCEICSKLKIKTPERQ